MVLHDSILDADDIQMFVPWKLKLDRFLAVIFTILYDSMLGIGGSNI